MKEYESNTGYREERSPLTLFCKVLIITSNVIEEFFKGFLGLEEVRI